MILQAPDDRKLKELMLYVADKSECDPSFGAVKLNKILFYSDFLMYLKLRESITGQEYMKLEHGPAPRRLLPLQEELISEGAAAVKETDYFGYPQKRLVALRIPDLSLFTGTDIAEVDKVINALWDLNGTQASELSHRFPGWKAAALRETIPYSTVYLSDRELTEGEKEYGRQVAARIAG